MIHWSIYFSSKVGYKAAIRVIYSFLIDLAKKKFNMMDHHSLKDAIIFRIWADREDWGLFECASSDSSSELQEIRKLIFHQI